MNNDLISRSELRTAIGKLVAKRHGYFSLRDIMNIIDNAPTVAVNCKDCDGYEAGYSAGMRDTERPQGEWKLHGMIWYCSNCGKDCEQGGNNFCGQCGADMRGKEE